MAMLFFRQVPVVERQHAIFGPIWRRILNICPTNELRHLNGMVFGKTPGQERGLRRVFS